MVDILFYVILSILLLIAPIFVRAEGVFSLDRKLAYLTFRLFRLKILSVHIYFHKEGVMVSLSGKAGKVIHGNEKRKERKYFFRPYLQMIHIKELRITAYAGGKTAAISLSLGAVLSLLGDVMDYLRQGRILDRGSVTILPCYVEDQTTVNFSITLFTSAVQILAALSHTKKGNTYGKRSDRTYDGENA